MLLPGAQKSPVQYNFLSMLLYPLVMVHYSHYSFRCYALMLLTDSDPTIHFAECEVRSCVTVPRGSFPVVLAKAPDMDTRINLCPQTARLFSGTN